MTTLPHLTAKQARDLLVGHLGLRQRRRWEGASSGLEVLRSLRCIQLDPLDRIGTNVDLVGMARLEGLRRGALHGALLGTGEVFEHFAKERCLLPAEVFPLYREQAKATPGWRSTEKMKRLSPALLEAVREEIAARGASTPGELEDRGEVEPVDWSGWRSTRQATAMALEVLWTRCEVVVAARTTSGKRYDLPSRVLGAWAEAEAAAEGYARRMLLERVAACGLMALHQGPWWSSLDGARGTGLVEALVASGELVKVCIQGARREYITLPALLEPGAFPGEEDDDGEARILGPLDPVIWDRRLVQHAFSFEYVWEVYKPAAQRRWGWYVCPILHRGRLVGRVEAHVEDGRLVLDRRWEEEGFEEAAWARAWERHAAHV